MSNTQSNIQTRQNVLANTSLVPQKFFLSGENNLVSYVSGETPKGIQIPGSIVSNKEKPGSFGLVGILPSKKRSAQELITTIHSNNEISLPRTFEFLPMFDELKDNRPLQMCLRITANTRNGIIKKDKLFHDGNGASNIIPLIVGPETVSIAEGWSPEELATLGFEENVTLPWGTILSGVVKAVPVIASAGLKIYEEINGSDLSTGAGEDESVEFVGIIGAAASIAATFVSALM